MFYLTSTAKYVKMYFYVCSTAPRKAIHERWTLLKSAHVHKKHRVQYEIRTYYRYLDILKLTGSTADTFLEYIQRNLPEGVAMKVTKVRVAWYYYEANSKLFTFDLSRNFCLQIEMERLPESIAAMCNT